MTEPAWKFSDDTRQSVFRTLDDGKFESRIIADAEITALIEASAILDPDPVDQKATALDELRSSDRDMARAGEDVIALLISKKIIVLDDLPKETQVRLLRRAELRAALK